MARDKEPNSTILPGGLSFEKPIEEVRNRLVELERLAGKTKHDLSEEIQIHRHRLEGLTREVYSNLTPWNRVQVARHPERPLTTDYVAGICTDFVELGGDGYYGDDKAILTGLATIGGRRVMLVGHRKGKTTKERLVCNFGSAHPEGYRKALRKMQLAARMRLPVVSLVNTPGAYPGVGAEERGQARAIAENILEMFAIATPIIVLVIGEGGSGGALGIAIGDRIGMLENAWYSVISPEGCASILWHSAEGREQAAAALKLTAADLHRFGIVDAVIPEPVGGAHRAPGQTLNAVAEQIGAWLADLERVPTDALLDQRHRKFRHMAQALAAAPAAGARASAVARGS